VQKLFGAGSVKVDPNYLGALGNSTSRIIVEEQLGSNVTLTYATNVNTTASSSSRPKSPSTATSPCSWPATSPASSPW
jgi:hypothetical protein